jgi:hypothetical protein
MGKLIKAEEDCGYSSMSDSLENSIQSLEARSKISNTDKELLKAADVTIALDDLHVVIGRIPEPTVTDVSLVMTASNLAVAGTGLSPNNFIPGIESYKTKVFSKAGLESIADRVCLILNYFLKNILTQSSEHAVYYRNLNKQFLDYKHPFNVFYHKFPIPDKSTDDNPRTLTLKLADDSILSTVLGKVKTQGDLLNQIKLANRHLVSFSKIALKTREAVEQTIKTATPNEKISNPIDAINFIKATNLAIYKDLLTIWNEVFLPSDLVKTVDDGKECLSTIPLPNNTKFGVFLKQLKTTPDLNMEQFLLRSDVIRSFSFICDSKPIEKTSEETVIENVTNTGLQEIIFSTEKLISDVLKFFQISAIGCESTANNAIQRNGFIDSCFDSLKPNKLDASVENEYRQYVQTYVGDIDNLYKVNNNISLALAEYFIYYVISLKDLLETTSSFKPEGTYNVSKTKPLF